MLLLDNARVLFESQSTIVCMCGAMMCRDTEAIPMARRGYARRATVGEIAKRAGVLMTTTASSASSSSPAGCGGLWELDRATSVPGAATEELEELRAVIAGLQSDNTALWRVVDELRRADTARQVEVAAMRKEVDSQWVELAVGGSSNWQWHQHTQEQEQAQEQEEGIPPV
jgi:hypothetical protein